MKRSGAAERRREVLLRVVRCLCACPLESEDRIGSLARMIVPDVADWCVIDLVEEGSAVGIRRVGVASGDPAREACGAELSRRYPPRLDRETPFSRALREARPKMTPAIRREDLAGMAVDEDHRRLLESLGMGSAIFAPMIRRGRTIGALSLVRDATARPFESADLVLAKEIADCAAASIENARLFERTSRTVRDRDDLVAIVSHDLKNPLGAIVMSVDLLERAAASGTVSAERVMKQGERIRRAADRMGTLIRDLLDVARIESGRFQIATAPMPTEAPVEEAIDLLLPLARERKIEIISPGSTGRLAPIRADRSRLLQAFSNLVGNAIQYSPEGSRVSIEAVEEGDFVRFTVRDEGAGIAPDALPHIFDRFWQVRERGGASLGLGLFITRGIVEAHGGRIWVDSDPGRGSAFHFTIPRAGEEARPHA